MRLLATIGLLLAMGYGGYWLGRYDERTLCRRTLQHRMTLTRDKAEELIETEDRIWSGQ